MQNVEHTDDTLGRNWLTEVKRTRDSLWVAVKSFDLRIDATREGERILAGVGADAVYDTRIRDNRN